MKREHRHGLWQATSQYSLGGLGLALLAVVFKVETMPPLAGRARSAAGVLPRR